ncbi:MAG: hypothetical protein IJH64_00575 [Oscillospiraceae bacterium]|nr:hypothetical protein [Oscillospiraceae bacterium]
MITGIEINGKHSFRDFGALLARRSFEYPEELQVVEGVPYSNIEYNFTDLFGEQVLMRRDVIYRFKFVDVDKTVNDENIARFMEFLYSIRDDVSIYEDDNPRYHWIGRRKTIKNIEDTVGHELGAQMIEVTFRCNPKRTSNLGDSFIVDASRFPDVDDDGAVTAADAALILSAASHIGSGEPSGLTPEQELKADCDRNGVISASDAALCLTFASQTGSGKYTNDPAGWAKFLNAQFGRDDEVI